MKITNDETTEKRKEGHIWHENIDENDASRIASMISSLQTQRGAKLKADKLLNISNLPSTHRMKAQRTRSVDVAFALAFQNEIRQY